WPEKLDELAPRYLSAVPLDPFDRKPLRLRRLDDGILIYSVGPDGVDDGGKVDPKLDPWERQDLGCRLWSVPTRRQPPRPRRPDNGEEKEKLEPVGGQDRAARKGDADRVVQGLAVHDPRRTPFRP